MTAPRLLCLLVLVLAVGGAHPEPAAAASPPSASCNGGGCGGWFRSNVTVTWSYDAGASSAVGCGASGVSSDTSGASFTCTVTYPDPGGPVSYARTVTVRKDSSPPGVTVSASRGPDSNGWYTSPVPFSASGDDGASGVASCTSGTYAGPDGTEARLSASCTDNAGNTGSGSTTVKYDGTPPTVTATPSRPPDRNGWYNHPVQIAFAGSDPGSGVKECSPTVEYKGPDAEPAKVIGQCRDNAGHLSAPLAFELRYDATKPTRPNVTTSYRGTAIAVSWTRPATVVRSVVVRAPGRGSKKRSVVFDGTRNTLVDRRITPGTRYWYQVRLFDTAGNYSATTVPVRPATGILSPAPGAVLRIAPLVKWSAVRRARFYNVQLWRGDAKVLTTWPKKPQLRLQRTWSFGGQRQRLAPGRYRLYVWPAFGTAKTPRYGKPVGQISFVVRR